LISQGVPQPGASNNGETVSFFRRLLSASLHHARRRAHSIAEISVRKLAILLSRSSIARLRDR